MLREINKDWHLRQMMPINVYQKVVNYKTPSLDNCNTKDIVVEFDANSVSTKRVLIGCSYIPLTQTIKRLKEMALEGITASYSLNFC